MKNDDPKTTDRSELPPTPDTYAGMQAARDGKDRQAPPDLIDERAAGWLWGYDAWGAWSLIAGMSR